MKKTTPSASRFFVAIAATLSAAGVVEAWSGGVGTCAVDPQSGPAFPDYAPHKDAGKGSLGSGEGGGRYMLVLGDTELAEGSVTTVTAMTDHALYVRRNDENSAFKGFLFTLQNPSQGDVSGSFKMEQATDPVRILESEGEGANSSPDSPAVCAAGVSGASHVNATEKDNAKLTLNVGSAVGSVDLTVTVLVAQQEWYFSTFSLDVVDGAPTPSTDAPTASPVGGNATSTSEPTEAPITGTTEPTAAPSGAHVVVGGIMSALTATSALVLTSIFA